MAEAGFRLLERSKIIYDTASVQTDQASQGFADKINFFATAEERADGSPPKPDTSVIDVCLNAMVYSAYLGLHYFRKNTSKSGRLVFTSSMAGCKCRFQVDAEHPGVAAATMRLPSCRCVLTTCSAAYNLLLFLRLGLTPMTTVYPGGAIPLYTAAKHGVVGMSRALAQRLEHKGEKITVNCICPGLVSTGLTQTLVEHTEDKYVTPVSTIVRAVMGFVDDASLNGQAAECSRDNIYYRKQPEFLDEEAGYVMTPHGRLEAAENGRGTWAR